VPDPENGNAPVVKRRHRTRRHRRNRRIRRWLTLGVLAVCSACATTVALQYFSLPFLHSRHAALPVVGREIPLNQAASLNQILAHSQQARPVYPYSVVAGGVEDVQELKWVAEHDPVVAAHYAGFNYARAQVVRLTLARTVYVSYRIGNKIYWTSHRITLRKGEKLITDGRMTARTRCANRVEETPQQQEASPVEPPAQKFEEPVGSGKGTAVQAPPVAFQSALVNRQVPYFEPMGPMSLYDPFVGGNYISVAVPPLPEGLCEPVKKKGTGTGVEVGSHGKKGSAGPCGEGGGVGTVPEPGTWMLVASGVGLIAWRYRSRLSACRSTWEVTEKLVRRGNGYHWG